MKDSLIRINVIFILLVLVIPTLTSAELKTFTKEYAYQASEADSKNSSQPKDEWAYFNQGTANGRIGNYKQAIKYFNKAIELNPELQRAYYNRAVAYEKLGNYDEAFKDFNKAIELNPQLAMFYRGRGFAYAEIGNYDQAINDYNTAIELEPKYAEAYLHRGFAYADLGNHNQAIKDFNKAVELDPQYSSAYNDSGLAYLKGGEYPMAGILTVVILVISIIIFVFFQVMTSIGAAGYNPSKLISEIFKRKSDKIGDLSAKTQVPFSDTVAIDDSKKINEPAFNRSIVRWRTVAGILMSVIMVYLLAFYKPSIGNAFLPFYPWINYAFWPLLFLTIFVFIILWKKERQS